MKLHKGRASKELLQGGYMSLIWLDWEFPCASSLPRFILIYKYANHSGLDWTTRLHRGGRTPLDLLNSHTGAREEPRTHSCSLLRRQGSGAAHRLRQLSRSYGLVTYYGHGLAVKDDPRRMRRNCAAEMRECFWRWNHSANGKIIKNA